MKIIIPALPSVSVQEDNMDSVARRRRDQDLQSLLSRKKLHLVLDLDHTLVHCTPVSKLTAPLHHHHHHHHHQLQDSADTHLLDGGELVLKFRPGVRSFLEEASAMFDLSIYTMGTRHYANQVAARLENYYCCSGQGLSFVKVISREDCRVEKRKGLDAVPSHRRAVLVVDDKVKVWAREDRDNVLSIAPYYYCYFSSGFKKNELLLGKEEEEEDDDDRDEELSRVLGVLREVHSRFFDDGDDDAAGGMINNNRDVSQVLKRVRLLRLYHGPPNSYHYYTNMLRRHRRRHQEKDEEGRGDHYGGGSKIKKIKIVFGGRLASRTTINLASQGIDESCPKRARGEEEEEEDRHQESAGAAWGPIINQIISNNKNSMADWMTNNEEIRCCKRACVR